MKVTTPRGPSSLVSTHLCCMCTIPSLGHTTRFHCIHWSTAAQHRQVLKSQVCKCIRLKKRKKQMHALERHPNNTSKRCLDIWRCVSKCFTMFHNVSKSGRRNSTCICKKRAYLECTHHGRDPCNRWGNRLVRWRPPHDLSLLGHTPLLCRKESTKNSKNSKNSKGVRVSGAIVKENFSREYTLTLHLLILIVENKEKTTENRRRVLDSILLASTTTPAHLRDRLFRLVASTSWQVCRPAHWTSTICGIWPAFSLPTTRRRCRERRRRRCYLFSHGGHHHSNNPSGSVIETNNQNLPILVRIGICFGRCCTVRSAGQTVRSPGHTNCGVGTLRRSGWLGTCRHRRDTPLDSCNLENKYVHRNPRPSILGRNGTQISSCRQRGCRPRANIRRGRNRACPSTTKGIPVDHRRDLAIERHRRKCIVLPCTCTFHGRNILRDRRVGNSPPPSSCLCICTRPRRTGRVPNHCNCSNIQWPCNPHHPNPDHSNIYRLRIHRAHHKSCQNRATPWIWGG
jgi:hypothetical protein